MTLNEYELFLKAESFKFWVNAITMALFRYSVIGACIKYIWS